MKKRESEYKPLLFTTTLRNPERLKWFLGVLKDYDGQVLNDTLAEEIAGEIIRVGLYKPIKISSTVKKKIETKEPLSDREVRIVLANNPQNHKEAGFSKGWASRFDTWFKIAKELGFVYYQNGKKIRFSEIGLRLVDNEHPEFEQQAFLNAFVKYQSNSPFRRVLNENAPLILLLGVIKRINADKRFNGTGISKLELPLVIFWKDNNAEKLYQLIKKIRKEYGYNPSWEVIVDICVNQIMGGEFKKFNHKSIMVDYPDEFIRKMRLTGLISLRGAGRFVDINKNEQAKVDYALANYSQYKKYASEEEYFEYMSMVDENLLSFVAKPVSIGERDKFLTKWISIYSWQKITDELLILAKDKLTKDDILKYLSSPVRLEFLVALAVKSKFPDVKVIPNYPYDDEGLPTSTAGGIGDKGDIECYESVNGVLIEVTMSEGRIQTVMEIWPIARHLEEFSKKVEHSMCYFVAPSIFRDSVRQIEFVKEKDNLSILPKTIKDFLNHLESSKSLYPA
ncbi:MAG: AlwI family type II restriction endonuclease [Candidatus Harrisonbacteria bacterium]|nr:AlwI family type II restriction endonuclease [Candidatus Harrisonbacteria bacterium]